MSALLDRIQAHITKRIANNDPLSPLSREEFEINSLWYVLVEIAMQQDKLDAKLVEMKASIAGARGALEACVAKLDEMMQRPRELPRDDTDDEGSGSLQ